MLSALIVLLVILWFLGYVQLPGDLFPNIILFSINGQSITLWSLLIFFLILWAIGILPSPLRQIVFVIFILWVLSTLGILAIAGLSSILVIAVIVGLIVSLLGLA